MRLRDTVTRVTRWPRNFAAAVLILIAVSTTMNTTLLMVSLPTKSEVSVGRREAKARRPDPAEVAVRSPDNPPRTGANARPARTIGTGNVYGGSASPTKGTVDACLSPERNIPWILNGECSRDPHASLLKPTSHHRRTCGFCGEGAEYLREVRDELSAKFKDRCSDLVVYGLALGLKYESWLHSTRFLGSYNKKVAQRHSGVCFVQFVTNHSGSAGNVSADGSQNLIVLDEDRLPYQNNRRNAKIFKLSPGLLFPWADRVIWQDAKLLRSSRGDNAPSPRGIPSDYHRHFNRTVQRFQTCSSFMGLPHHRSAVGQASTVNLKVHCETIINAAKKRPSVSDSLDVLRAHCKRNENEHQNPTDLVDSAFIVWDMRSLACRKFNGNLGCSWLDEIHCYSDRDQISFPSALAASGVHLSSKAHDKSSHQELRDRVYVNENNVPMVHLSKRTCHWYYRSFSRCVAPQGEGPAVRRNYGSHVALASTTGNGKEKGSRVAVIVAGTLQRFMFKSTLQRLIAPLIKSQVDVDYYVSLTTAPAKADSLESDDYTSHAQSDPFLPSKTEGSYATILEDFIRKKISNLGASIGDVTIQDSIDIDSEAMLAARRGKALKDHPDEDPDLRFPIFDIRSDKIRHRTTNKNRNILRMHLAIQNLWRSALKWEEEEAFKYDFVMFLRDDALWLSDFKLSPFALRSSDAFVPACDAGAPPLYSKEWNGLDSWQQSTYRMNDHVVISRRNAADIFGNYYSKLFNIDLNACVERLQDQALSVKSSRGCNSEMLLKWVIENEHLKVENVGQGMVPFQRSVNIRLPDGSNQQCFHKLCQSKERPLELSHENSQLQECKQAINSSVKARKMAPDEMAKPAVQNTKTGKTRIALCFYGIIRNMTAVLGSIQRHIFQVLERNHIEFDVFLHTYSVNQIATARSGRTSHANLTANGSDFVLLRPNSYQLQMQHLIREELFNAVNRSHSGQLLDPYIDGFYSVKNYLCALNSQAQVAQLAQNYSAMHSVTYSAAVSLRLDVAFIRDIEVPMLISLEPTSKVVLTPSFEAYGGLNDRFAFGGGDVMLNLYMQQRRLSYMKQGMVRIQNEPNEEMSQRASRIRLKKCNNDEWLLMRTRVCRAVFFRQRRRVYNVEGFLRHFLTQQNVDISALSTMRVLRVRGDGVVSKEDRDPKKMNISKAEIQRCVTQKLESRRLGIQEGTFLTDC